MGPDKKVEVGASELDDMQKRFAKQRFSDEDADGDNEEAEPKGSRGTPEGRNKIVTTEDGKRVMLVAARSRVKQVAGSVARTTRDPEGEPPILSAVGAASVNQAVKAIAIARDFLDEDGHDLAVEVEKRPQETVKDVLVFTLSKHPRGTLVASSSDKDDEATAPDGVAYQDMRSAAASQPSALAGAIAKNVRENKRPRITAIGQKPVFRAVCAVALARKYLKKENLDIDMVPRFTHVHFENGSDANALQLIILPRRIA